MHQRVIGVCAELPAESRRDGVQLSFGKQVGDVGGFEQQQRAGQTPGKEEPGTDRGRAGGRARGIDRASLVVVSANAEERKGRRDHRIVFEVPSQSAGEARRRVTVSVAGAVPSLVATALEVPEEWAPGVTP